MTALCKRNGRGSIVLAPEHIPLPQAATTAVNLRAIHIVENINALKPGERLTFDRVGITVVYGDNGSGKSGYSRVLKQVCRARVLSKDDNIRPNIYGNEARPQKAIIDFSANGQNKREDWTVGDPSDPLLSAVSVFDSRTANVHVDELNDVAYTPFPIRLLERLAEACQEIRKRLNAEIQGLKRHTPQSITNPKCRVGTTVGKLITGLTGETKEIEVCNLATLSNNDKARLSSLTMDLGNDRSRMARQVGALKNRLAAVDTRFEVLQKAVMPEKVSHLVTLFRTYCTAQAAAKAAADALFASELLPDIGSDVWRTLWEAARRYSEQQAYPELPFPFISDGARCVLCQQELDGDAANRLVRFEAFVRDETKRKEEQAESAYRAALDELTDSDVSARDVSSAVALIRDELNDNRLATSVRRAAVTLKWRRRLVLRKHTEWQNTDPVPSADEWPVEGIERHNATLTARIATMLAEDKSEERKQMRGELEELEDRHWLAVVREEVLAEINRRKTLADLNDVLKDTATNRITTKSGEIAEQLVTNALRAQFSKEINRFGVAGLAIELRKEKTSYGVPYFRVSLIRKPDARVGEILSEGEHRCVALAAFLAELATTESRSTIVFDDPVSSLDHMHRKEVAERLADEGQNRQIVLLTHDIAFLFLIEQACREKGTHLAFRSVTRTDDHAGFVQQDPPARAQRIDKVIESMQERLNNERRFFENGDHDEWESTVDALQKRLRSTWERAVEEVIGPVFKRLSNKVETKGLSKVTALTMDDCTEMRRAYGRCSKLLHSSADTLNPPQPKPEAVQNEITVLRDWVENIRDRQAKISYLQ